MTTSSLIAVVSLLAAKFVSADYWLTRALRSGQQCWPMESNEKGVPFVVSTKAFQKQIEQSSYYFRFLSKYYARVPRQPLLLVGSPNHLPFGIAFVLS